MILFSGNRIAPTTTPPAQVPERPQSPFEKWARRAKRNALRLALGALTADVVAIRGEGVAELADRCEAHSSHLRESGLLARKEEERTRDELIALVQHELTANLLGALAPGELDGWVRRVASREADPYAAARDLVHRK